MTENSILSRRVILGSGAAITALRSTPGIAQPDVGAASPRSMTATVRFKVNGRDQELALDPRTTLLDALREHLGLIGSKKGCDHGQCGACTVLVNGERRNACLNLAIAREGDEIVTIEGLGDEQNLHPMQAAFLAHDGFQCGYCTPGQVCSAIGMLAEMRQGMPSAVTPDLAAESMAIAAAEIRERMSGNICRCAAYPNIVAAIQDAAGKGSG
jgi:xanthine dehydrogenase YagT iron-sulfur-binding subunit